MTDREAELESMLNDFEGEVAEAIDALTKIAEEELSIVDIKVLAKVTLSKLTYNND